MNGRRTYLDHNATSPLRPEARAAAVSALDAIAGNPSSVHDEGRRARAIVETAREQVASLVNARPLEVVFTSGATEANAWVLGGGWNTIFRGGFEHDSVLAPAAASGARMIDVPVGTDGVARVETIAQHVFTGSGDFGRSLVALQLANNETGVIQPVAETAAFAVAHGLSCHTDAVQAAGRIRIDFNELGVDTLSLSAHKLGGLSGMGALIIRDGTRLASFLVGGGQERRRRAGTENVIGIAAFGAAAVAATRDVATAGRLSALRGRLERGVAAITPTAIIVGAEAPRLPNTSSVALPGGAAETLVIKFDLAGIAVSAGAACSSGKVGVSHVLTAMGLDQDIARGAIRVSLGWNTSEADVDAFLTAWHEMSMARVRAVA